MLRARHAVAALIIAAAASTPRSTVLVHGADQTATELAAALQRKYDGIKDFSADFAHAYEGGVLKKKITERGHLVVKKPGKMRWDYKGKGIPIVSSYLTDGTNAWLVEYNNHQYGKKKLSETTDTVALTFLSGRGDLRKDFTPEIDHTSKYGGKSDYVLKLTPKTPSTQFKTLFLVVDPGNFRVKQSIVLEGNGNVNHFMFYEPDFSKDLPDSLFWVNEAELKKAGWRQLAKEQPQPEQP